MTPAQLARLQAARRLSNSATVQIVLDEYHALIPTLRAADSVPALQGEIAHLKSALAAQVEATEREARLAAEAKAHADEVRKKLQAGKASAESRALRAEAALEQGHGELLARIAALTEMLPICKVAGCEGRHYAKRMCQKHYMKAKREAAAAPCVKCGTVNAPGVSGRCRQCYVAALMAGGRDGARRDRIEVPNV